MHQRRQPYMGLSSEPVHYNSQDTNRQGVTNRANRQGVTLNTLPTPSN